jgi:hypothetical protein
VLPFRQDDTAKEADTMKQRKGEIVALVISAGVELEQHEYLEGECEYFQLGALANETDAIGRANIAEACYLYGTRELRGSRAFDNCFENGDGDQVVAELTRRADRDPKLHAAIRADFSGTYPASWRAAAEAETPQLAMAL